MRKIFLPGTVRNIRSQSYWIDTKGLSQPYGILSIVIIMVLVALLLSYIMITSCDDECSSRNNTVSTTKIISHRDLILTCHDPGSIFTLYELVANTCIQADGNFNAIDLNTPVGRAEKLTNLFSPLIT